MKEVRRHKLKLQIPHWWINLKIIRIARKIVKDHSGDDLLMIYVLQGALVFAERLGGRIERLRKTFQFTMKPIHADSMDKHISSGKVDIQIDPKITIKGKDIILVEDICDTGLTLSEIIKLLLDMGAKSVKVACLFLKPNEVKFLVHIDYLGFKVKGYVVGEGLDYDEFYRLRKGLWTVVFLDSE